jgi:LPXTG-motif cell wall-anchored protein
MKKILISLLSIIFIISMFTSTYAATNGSINVGASADTVIKGKTFTVTVAATAESNIKGMQSGLSYDTNKLSIESKSAGQGYFDASGSNEIAIGSTSSESLAQSGTLYTITFKVLDTAAEGPTTISVTNAKMSLVSGETDPTSGEVTINIKADDTTAGGANQENQTPSNGDNGNAGTDGSNGNGGTEDKKEEVAQDKNANKNTTNKKKPTTKLPQTGVESTILIAIVALGAVSIVSYISYRKYNI